MGNLKEVRNRITSVKSTQQITKAMKMVSAAKLRRAQGRIQQMRPYDKKLKAIIQNLSSSGEEGVPVNEFYEQRQVNKVLLVPITADRGLAGSLNSVVIKETVRLLKNDYSRQFKEKNLGIYSIGKKGRDFFKKYNYSLVTEHNYFFNDFTYEKVEAIAEDLMLRFKEGEYDLILLIYNSFKNAAVYRTTVDQFLPVQQIEVPEAEKTVRPDFIFEPSKEDILEKLVPHSLKTNLFRVLLDTNASEHGARMTSMDKATENAEDLLKALKLQYNKERQATITKELLDIVGGARALEG